MLWRNRTCQVAGVARDYAGGLDPSVAQPPLPLQLFFPLQPLSPVLQPPLPLQLFWPLQACLSFLSPAIIAVEDEAAPSCAPLWLLEAWRGVAEPLSSPVTAALSIIALKEFFITSP